jgi:hypothetical protein
MKKQSMIAMFALASLTILSLGCHQPKDGYSNASTSWNWTGTAPLSADIDGVHYQATNGSVASPFGAIVLTGSDNTDSTVSIIFTGIPEMDVLYDCPSTAKLGFDIKSSTSDDYFAATSGEVKVLSLTGNTIEGMFYGTVKDSATGVTHTLKNGYFKMSK